MKAAETLSDGLEKLEQIVRPLEWHHFERGDSFYALTVIGQYSAWYVDGDGYWRKPDSFVPIRVSGGLVEAQSAAQAHFNAALAPALNLEPILSEIKRMREALGDGRSARWAAHYDIPDHLGWDLRMIADGKDQRAGFETMDGAIMRRAASCFDGLPESTTSDEAMRLARESLSTLSPQEPDNG